MKYHFANTLARLQKKAAIRSHTWLAELVRGTQRSEGAQPRLTHMPYEWDAVATEEWLRQVGFAPANGSSGTFVLEWNNLADHWGPQRVRVNSLCRSVAKQFDDRLAAGGMPVAESPSVRVSRPVRTRSREFA